MGRQNQRHSILGISLVSIWLLFTISLAGWWIYFGLEQVDRLINIQHQDAAVLVRYQKMLIWEGCAMLLSIVLGGSALVYYIYREVREGKKLQQFFAAFTHEVKTPLASARLKGEILKERISDPENVALINKMLADVGRLSLRLENSLFLADEGAGQLFIESVDVSSLISGMRDFWPDLDVHHPENCFVRGDRRILDTAIANIFQNAVIHGKATQIVVTCSTQDANQLLSFVDNGAGFTGERTMLGKLFGRHYSGSGSGIGLYLVDQLMKRLGGEVTFPPRTDGFEVKIHFARP